MPWLGRNVEACVKVADPAETQSRWCAVAWLDKISYDTVRGPEALLSSTPNHHPTMRTDSTDYNCMAPAGLPRPHSKAQQLLKSPFGRALVVAEVVTLVGSAALYYKLTTDAGSRAKMERYAPFVMDAFHQVTRDKFRDRDESGSGSGKP